MKITLEYEGTWFHGFQRQGGLRTVQSVVEEAFGRLFDHPVQVVAAGRTDAGVHARGQVVSTRCAGSIPTANIARAVNSLLPEDVAVSDVQEVAADFNANRCAHSKVYRYYISVSAIRSPFLSRYALSVEPTLDIEAMSKAAAHYLGKHDFSAFRAAGSAVKTSTRTVMDSRLWTEQGMRKTICFQVEANGFLYNMVRIMTGTLLLVGRGKISPDDLPGIIQSRDRALAGPTVPPHGLWLWGVRY